MMSTKKTNGIMLLLIGLFIFLSLISMKGGIPREVKPMFDGQTNVFNLEMIETAARAEEGDIFWVDVNIINMEEQSGSMYVQCSILDRNEHNWIIGLQSVTKLNTEENCVNDEPFTQSAKVYLDGKDSEIVTLSFRVPYTNLGDNVIFCEAFEQCWFYEEGNTRMSDYIVKEITVEQKDAFEQNNNLYESGDECETDSDCSLLPFFSETICMNGYCVDLEDSTIPEMELYLSNTKDWVKENSSILFIGSIILIMIGLVIAFKD